MIKTQPEDYITAKEAAQILMVTPQRIRQLCIDEKVTAKKVLRDWWIEKQSVIAYNQIPQKGGRPRSGKTQKQLEF